MYHRDDEKEEGMYWNENLELASMQSLRWMGMAWD